MLIPPRNFVTGLPRSFRSGHSAKGAEMMVGHTLSDRFYLMSPLDVNTIGCRLDIGPDGKSAKVVVETMGNLVFNPTDTNSDNVNNIVGGMKWRQEFDFDLSSETPTIVAARIGQSIEA